MEQQVNRLMATGNLEPEEMQEFLRFRNAETTEYLNKMACSVRKRAKKDKISIWGRIPISNYCKYDCKMCGIRRDNQFAKRYRMSEELVLEFCHIFAEKGISGFWLESGDDVYYNQNHMQELISKIHHIFPDKKLILSLGEKTEEACRAWLRAGADSYIFSHGSANEIYFKRIFPSNMSLLIRKQCLWQLKEVGYHVGTGFLVGVPYQTVDNVREDLQFIKSFTPSIIDLGAFVPALRTPFERERSGNGEMVLYLLAILRLMLPKAKIIASPTLDCVMREGRIKAFGAGADILVVDLPEETILKRYCVYERKNGRLGLPVDDVGTMLSKLRTMGLVVS